MNVKRFKKRASGVVMPIFSLPSPYGIGTLGKEAYKFAKALQQAGQSYWQITPLGHTGYGGSPYQCFSSVAGNPFFIDLDNLVDMKLLSKDFLESLVVPDGRIDYAWLDQTRLLILKQAFKNRKPAFDKEFENFVTQQRDWILDYALFMALKSHFSQKPVWEWDDQKIKQRDLISLASYTILLREDFEFYMFIQYLFFKQWYALKSYANSLGISIIGDLPMYPSPDSADVWASPIHFKVDKDLRASGIAGVPPDYFSKTGQLWGNPVYDWSVHQKEEYSWWIRRIQHTSKLYDVIRIDHFRAFESYWEIPAGEDTAINGKWMPGPGIEFFKVLKSKLGDIPIIAEDLGIITNSVRKLLKNTRYPGMAVSVFGYRANEDNIHLPHNVEINRVLYTSTHDSETISETLNEVLSIEDRLFALSYMNAQKYEPIGISATRSVFASPARLAMVMMTDLLSLGSKGRINIPGTVGGINWTWRAERDFFTDQLIVQLHTLTETYKRLL